MLRLRRQQVCTRCFESQKKDLPDQLFVLMRKPQAARMRPPQAHKFRFHVRSSRLSSQVFSSSASNALSDVFVSPRNTAHLMTFTMTVREHAENSRDHLAVVPAFSGNLPDVFQTSTFCNHQVLDVTGPWENRPVGITWPARAPCLACFQRSEGQGWKSRCPQHHS